MTQEDITLTELDRRLAMFDPYLPRADVMADLHALHDAQDEVRLWRRVTFASLLVTLVAAVVTSGVLIVGTTQASELLVFEKLCMTPSAAETLVSSCQSVATTNAMCVAQHERDREFLQAMFARSDETYKAAEKAGVVVFAIGGQDTYEDVPMLPDTKATDFVLHGEEPGRRAGVVVQAVQQQNP